MEVNNYVFEKNFNKMWKFEFLLPTGDNIAYIYNDFKYQSYKTLSPALLEIS
jgi:hypothetical protein